MPIPGHVQGPCRLQGQRRCRHANMYQNCASNLLAGGPLWSIRPHPSSLSAVFCEQLCWREKAPTLPRCDRGRPSTRVHPGVQRDNAKTQHTCRLGPTWPSHASTCTSLLIHIMAWENCSDQSISWSAAFNTSLQHRQHCSLGNTAKSTAVLKPTAQVGACGCCCCQSCCYRLGRASQEPAQLSFKWAAGIHVCRQPLAEALWPGRVPPMHAPNS